MWLFLFVILIHCIIFFFFFFFFFYFRSNNLGVSRAAVAILFSFCSNTRADYSDYVPQLLRGLIQLFTHTDEEMLKMAWNTLNAVTKVLLHLSLYIYRLYIYISIIFHQIIFVVVVVIIIIIMFASPSLMLFCFCALSLLQQ